MTKLIVAGGLTAPGNPTAETHLMDVLEDKVCTKDSPKYPI